MPHPENHQIYAADLSAKPTSAGDVCKENNAWKHRWLLSILSFLLVAITINAAEGTTEQKISQENPPQSVDQEKFNTLSEAEKKSGWESLFDGKSTQHWRNYRKKKVSDGWTIVNGAISRTAKNAGDIVTKKKYKHFELSLEYKISKGGNSGVMFHVSEDESNPWMTGPEIQIQDNIDGHDPQKSGWLYGIYQPTKPNWIARFEKSSGIKAPEIVDATRPAEQWNHLYVRVASNQSEVFMNGTRYYTFVKGSIDWNERVAKSKFNKYPKFGKNEAGHICLQDHGDLVSYRNIKIRELDERSNPKNATVETLNVNTVPAFPKLKWTGWDDGEKSGRSQVLRPITLTHANDQSKRLFVATQHGAIHVFANDQNVEQTKVFLDLTKKTRPFKKANEEGLLGLAFPADYKTKGKFYVYYSPVAAPKKSYISRFSVSTDDPDRADPDSEEVLLEIPQPFPNHNGGSLVFGNDGYLYIGLGDGGLANDPFRHGQNRKTLLGSILRIDVSAAAGGKKYAIPADNPFLKQPETRPEIYALGIRNVWQLSKDSKTGDIWFGDVGQALWEEINILKAGGNYGWNNREGKHLFGNARSTSSEDLVEPIWEYDHLLGKSITGGLVYRGKLKSLQGAYLYADYFSGKTWALQFDPATKQATRNFNLPLKKRAVLAFGEDEAGEAYLLTESRSGISILRFTTDSQ